VGNDLKPRRVCTCPENDRFLCILGPAFGDKEVTVSDLTCHIGEPPERPEEARVQVDEVCFYCTATVTYEAPNGEVKEAHFGHAPCDPGFEGCINTPEWDELRPYDGPVFWHQFDDPTWRVHGPYYRPERIHWYEDEFRRKNATFNTILPGAEDIALGIELYAYAAYHRWMLPQTSLSLLHFLYCQDGERRIRLEEVYEESSAMHAILEKDRLSILLWARNAAPGVYHLANGTYEDVPIHGDWYTALGRMVLWPEADVEVVCDPERRVTVNYTLHLYDPYWWEDVGEEGLARLHQSGLARIFVHVGEMSVTYSFP
jgi:hypothetical protein